jgi:hemerythrin superfamily protein
MIRTLAQKLDPEQDAIDLLKQDHRKVEALFKAFKAAGDKRTQKSIARQICIELEIHAKIEERLFYPAAKREADAAEDDVNEGIVEHEGIKRLVRQLSNMNASDELFESRMTVLEEYVRHHVKEEESSMFPKIVESGLDLKELGQRLMTRKRRLRSARGMSTPDPAGSSPRGGRGAAEARASS